MNRCWRLLNHPSGNDFAAAFAFEQIPIPTPQSGEVLIRNEYLSLDAGTRLWMSSRTDGYQPPVPLGSIMPGLVLGRVVESKHAGFKPGELVRGFGQWADYSCVDAMQSALQVVDESVQDPRQHFGVLGLNAWTAYVGLADAGAARPGETVLVSAAAGATGSLAAQIAKLMGCRVIGLAGGAQKCAFLRDEIGLDVVIDYKHEDVAAVLAIVDGGIDVYFDNVGGPLLDAVLPNMALHGRIAICGLIASYGSDAAPLGPARFDQILMRRLTIRGFFAPDFLARGPEIDVVMRRWLERDQIRMHFDVTNGLEHVLTAYAKLFTGSNLGKVLIRL